MRSGFHLVRIFGININIDWSWIFIFVLVTWNLGVVFGNVHPGWGAVFQWGIALLAALLFFASVLAHELAHSLTARTQGIPVRRITLFLFGGVSNIEKEPPSPQAEFLITIVGPLTSIILGALFIAAGILTTGPLNLSLNPATILAGLSPASTVLLWLGQINILLGIFNLIPGFPLDGGRLLRSILWAITDNLRRATRWASWVGQGIAWLMIGLGIAMAFGVSIPILGTGLISGLWLAFIGWFLNSAAVQSYQQVVVQDLLEGVPVGRMMRRNAPVVPPDCSVSDLVHDHIMGTDDHAFPVMEDGKLIGMVTLNDVRSVDRNQWDVTRVRDIMTARADLVVATPEEDAADALNKMTQSDFRQLPVVSDGHLEGMLRRRDLVRWLQLQSDRTVGGTAI
jgi:Zn-dependent protease/CBS domain-containing protein